MRMEEIGPGKDVVAKVDPVAKESKKDNFHEITDLPSKFRLYPEGTKIYARPLKVLEVKSLASLSDGNANYIINNIIKSTIKGIDPDKLLVADKLYLIFWLRANTYKDSGYVVDFNCRKCDTQSKYEFGLDCLNINEIKDEYNPNHEIVLSNGDKIKTRQLTVEFENVVPQFISKNKNAISQFNDELLGIANLITEINDKPMSLMQKYDYLSELSPGDYVKIETYILDNEIGLDPIMNVTCKNCGGSSPVAVSFRSDFFIPRFESK